MLPAFPSAFKLGRWSRLAILPVLLLLAACQTGGNSSGAAGPGRVQVALLVPSGSPDHNVNQVAASLSQAAQLAVSERGGDLVDLRIYSTAGDAAQAASVAQQAVNEGANVILGPLYAQNAAAVGRAVAGRGVSVLSFSNNTDIAGGNVFVLGNTFENTARRVADFAARRGKGRMIVVHGQTPAETFAKDAVAKVAPSTRASVVGSIGFEFSQEGVNTATPQIITTAQTQGAQAILLTSDTGGALPAITGALKDNGLPEVVQLIGLTRWDIPSSATSLPGLQNGWFALPNTATVSLFNTKFAQAFGVNPHPTAAFAYDGMALIAKQAKRSGPSGMTPNALIGAGSFDGATGQVRLLTDGTNDRALAIGTIRNNSVLILDQAPTNLGTTGL